MDKQRRDAMRSAFETLAKELQETYDFSAEELARSITAQRDAVPADAFDSPLTPFETVTRYLEKTHDVTAIADIVGRAPSVVKRTLASSYEKLPLELKGTSEHTIDPHIFADRTLSFSEHLCVALREQGLSNADIARLIGKDARTVWTHLDRAEKKRGDAQ